MSTFGGRGGPLAAGMLASMNHKISDERTSRGPGTGPHIRLTPTMIAFMAAYAAYVLLPRFLPLEVPFGTMSYLVLAAAGLVIFRDAIARGWTALRRRGWALLWFLPAMLALDALLTTAGALLSEWLAGQLAAPGELGNDERISGAMQAMHPVAAIAILGIAGPFTEELIYRLTLLGGVLRRVPFWLALLVSSALFGLLHASSLEASELIGVLPHAAAGIALGLSWRLSGSILVPFALHALMNLSAVIPAVLSSTP